MEVERSVPVLCSGMPPPVFGCSAVALGVRDHGVLSARAQVMWVCNLCRKQQEILTKSGEWFSGSGAQPGSLGTSSIDPAAGGEARRDRKLVRSRSQAPPTGTDADAAPPDAAQPASGVAAAAKGADTMPGSRCQSEPPREK